MTESRQESAHRGEAASASTPESRVERRVPPLRVMLVERCPLVRTGLRHILEDEPDIDVVAEASNGRDARRLVRAREIDVVVISTTVDAAPVRAMAVDVLLVHPHMKIVCVGRWAGSEDVAGVLGAGVLGCVELRCALDIDLMRAVRCVSRGERYLSLGWPGSAADDDAPGLERSYERLTAREKQVLGLIARSKSNREIAVELNLSVNTVAVHRSKMMRKLGVRKATALALFAADRGLISRD